MEQSSNAAVLSAENNQLVKQAVQVHKFGGSSLANKACIERVVGIIQQHCQLNDIVVVSANGNTTDDLFAVLALAKSGDASLNDAILALKESQATLIASLLNKSSAARLIEILDKDIQQFLTWIDLDIAKFENDLLAFGELWSARLMSAVLNERVCPSRYIDARDFLVINNERDCQVLYPLSEKQLAHCRQPEKLTVVTGYISKDADGLTKTLGRNGSDYSATIMAALVRASNVTLWTDVDGIYSADPRVVPHSRKLHRLPNGVAKELGRLGNPVLHAKTLQPLTNHSTHLHVASSFAFEVGGTEIGTFGQIAKQELSVTYLNDLLLARSESFTGDRGQEAAQEFEAITYDVEKGFIVIYQHQQKALSQWLACHDTEVSFIPAAIMATVGHKVVEHGDIKARYKRSLKDANVLEFVSSENKHSLIAVMPQNCTIELLNNVHYDMTKDARHIGLVVAGLGNIGQRFIEMLPHQLNSIHALENVHLVGLVTSKKALVNNDGIDVNHALEQFEQYAQPYDNEQFLSWLANHPYDELVVVDITPSEQFSHLYRAFFEQGIHVVGANKWAGSAPTQQYIQLLETAKKHQSLWLGNTTVGAGLPINHVIKDLLNSGDTITEISGIFSGTLSWLFENYDGETPFSTLLLDALNQGLTEPDPREDLSGRDVQRKLLILARMAGFELSLEDIHCQNLVPEALRTISKNEFFNQVPQLDDYFLVQLQQAKQQQKCIRYIARFSVEEEKINASISLEQLAQDDAFANLSACDNIFQVKSQWYDTNPLIVRGPGAGRDVTAGGLHSDLVSICQQLVSRTNQVKIKSV
ncbi:bifunctional aspartate kinase/homoserine dehydrogenase II [Thalassotalea profundi]|uniref:Bifunctional aspartokinase/homoserine dehydrogenase n=1 Tax=Thalassotalea profundi TaxID=2036687 RepID=A0ABQ3J6X0_9GAMM|nr:bifunctional aspartate kinase/homoserine dehydrogenase II [Thalassotalea profundi]GHF02278.1 bifunctional aspartokinase II/homoserine dehydrogenase II [Thalassotalea profundi]